MSDRYPRVERIALGHSRRLTAGALAAVALAVWLVGGMTSIAPRVFGADMRLPFTAGGVAALLWFAGALALLVALFWISFGTRVLEVRGTDLLASVQILSLTVYRWPPYSIADVRNVRFEEYRVGYRGKSESRYRLSFDYRGEVKQLLTHLSQRQVARLRSWGGLLPLIGNSTSS
jgi:hypothetical protein